MKKSLPLSLLSFIALFNWALAVDGDSGPRRDIHICETHFKYKLISLDGEWESYVHYASEDGIAVMPDNNCEKVTWFQEDATSKTTEQFQHPVIVSNNKPVVLGHRNAAGEDFYGVLTVTMTQKPNGTLPLYKKEIDVESKLLKRDAQSSPPPKMCMFYIGAKGPAQPVLHSHGFHNASCTLKFSLFDLLYVLTSK